MRFSRFAAILTILCLSGSSCGSSNDGGLASAVDSAISRQVHYRELRCECERRKDPSSSCEVPPRPSAKLQACHTRVFAFDESWSASYLACLDRAYAAASACVGSGSSCSCKDVLDLYAQECDELPEQLEDALDECEPEEPEETETTVVTPRTTVTAGASAPPTLPVAGSSAPRTVSVACGQKMCTGISSVGLSTMPCCFDPAAGSCGTMSGAQCMAPPPVAPLCPSYAIAGSKVNGCCRPDNTCGVDASAAGMGCADASSLARFGIMVAPPTRCDGTPVQ